MQRRLYLYDVVAAAVIARVMLGVFAVDKISRRHFVKYCAVLSFLFNAHSGITNAAVQLSRPAFDVNYIILMLLLSGKQSDNPLKLRVGI